MQLGTGTPEEQARAFFTRYKATLHASGSADEIRIASTAIDPRGGSHIRVEHHASDEILKVVLKLRSRVP